jgi:hypothetical protein
VAASVAALLGAAGSTPIDAATTLVLRGGAGHSDNVGRLPDNGASSMSLLAGAELGYAVATPRVVSSVDGDIQFVRYDRGSVEDEVLGGVDASMRLTLYGDRVFWNARETFGQQLGSLTAPSAPENREDVNTFTTGPDIVLLAGSRDQLVVALRGTRSSYERADIDSVAGSLDAVYTRRLTPSRSVGLTVRRQQVDYADLDDSFDVELTSLLATFAAANARGGLDAELGVTRRQARDGSGQGLRAMVSSTLALGRRTSARVAVETGYSEAGALLRQAGTVPVSVADTRDVARDPGVLRNSGVTLSVDRQARAAGVSVRARWRREDYTGGSVADRDVAGISGSVARDFGPRLRLSLDLGAERRWFRDAADSRDLVGGARLDYQAGERAGVRAEFRHTRRRSPDAGVEFEENAVLFTLVIDVLRARPASGSAGDG